MTQCSRCHRRLKREPIVFQSLTLGPVCARAVGAPRTEKAARARKQAKQHAVRTLDERQAEMFAGAA